MADNLLQEEDIDGTPVLRLRGQINLDNSPALRERLKEIVHEHRPQRVVIDLTHATYMDSSGIAVLIELLGELKKHGGRLVLFGLQPRVRGMLEITRLLKIFTICDDQASALNA